MRRWMILVMVLLLPLRGWAGDLMSLQMATASLQAASLAAMPADCLMHIEAQGNTGMESCVSCELCIPIAELAPRELVSAGYAAHEKPPMRRASFVSASPAPADKPPIS